MRLEDLGFEESRHQVPFTVRIKQFKDFKEENEQLRVNHESSLSQLDTIVCESDNKSNQIDDLNVNVESLTYERDDLKQSCIENQSKVNALDIQNIKKLNEAQSKIN